MAILGPILGNGGLAVLALTLIWLYNSVNSWSSSMEAATYLEPILRAPRPTQQLILADLARALLDGL